jgi:hypothetical protein
MRIVVRVLSLVSIALSILAVALYVWDGAVGFADTDVRGYFFLLAGAAGLVVAAVTVIVGLIAAALGREDRWLLGFVGAVVLCSGGVMLANGLLSSATFPSATDPACLGPNPTAPQCQVTQMQLLEQNAPLLIALITPLVIGAVGVLYSLLASSTSTPAEQPG